MLGVATLGLFYFVEALQAAGFAESAAAAAVPMRLLIIPMYVFWLPGTMIRVALAGPGSSPGALDALIRIVELAAGFSPYLLADLVLPRGTRTRVVTALPPHEEL
jgi:hypothetical protein